MLKTIAAYAACPIVIPFIPIGLAIVTIVLACKKQKQAHPVSVLYPAKESK